MRQRGYCLGASRKPWAMGNRHPVPNALTETFRPGAMCRRLYSASLTRRKTSRTIAGFIEDAVLLLLVLLLIPATILLIGGPVALLIRVLLDIAARF